MNCFQEADIRPTDVELISYGCGPGSFTGVRISAAACQAVAMASGAMVVPLASSWVLAATALAEHSALAAIVCSQKSRGDAYYYSAYQRSPDGLLRNLLQLQPDILVDAPPLWLGEFLEQRPGVAGIVGDVPGWLPTTLQAGVDTQCVPQARHMIEPARARHLAGDSVAAELALPSYISGDSPWKKQAAN